MTRPAHLVGVVGTRTDIGKTWITARVAAALRQGGRTVAIRKPAQSFDADAVTPTDADVLGGASDEPPEVVCPAHRWYSVPMAPPMAAEALGLPVPTVADLVGEIRWPVGPIDVGFLEAVGGVRSPVAADGDSRALVVAARVDQVVLVADAGLGTIDAVRLGADVLAPLPVVVVLNRFDPDDDLHRRNLAWLRERDGYDVVCSAEELVARLS